MKTRGCLIAVAAALGLAVLAAVLVGPPLLREGERIYAPIAKMQGKQEGFEAWSREKSFKAPAGIELSIEQIDRFLDLRVRLDAVDEANPLPVEEMRRDERPNLAEIQGLIEGVGGAVMGRMDAYREAGMTPEEYRYIERTIYRQWLRPLRARGHDPAAVARVAKELSDLAGVEKDAPVAARLRRLARRIGAERIPPPPGFPPEIHALLLERAARIEALIDAGRARASERNGVDF